MENASLDMIVSGAINAPVIKIPKTTITVKKDFTGIRKQFKFSAEMEKPVSKYVSNLIRRKQIIIIIINLIDNIIQPS